MKDVPTPPPVIFPQIATRPIPKPHSQKRQMAILLLLMGLAACTALVASLVFVGRIPTPNIIRQIVNEPDHAEREAVRKSLKRSLPVPAWEEVLWWKPGSFGKRSYRVIRLRWRSQNELGAMAIHEEVFWLFRQEAGLLDSQGFMKDRTGPDGEMYFTHHAREASETILAEDFRQ